MREKKEVGECGVANALLCSYLCSLKYAPTLIMFATCWQLYTYVNILTIQQQVTLIITIILC